MPTWHGRCARRDGAPRIENENVLCLHYPAAPCVYRWRGESRLDPAALEVIPAHKVALAGNRLISTGWGSFVMEIVVRTPRGYEEDVEKALGLAPSYRDDDPNGAYYLWRPTHTRRGDDETIVWTLAHHLPAEIPRRIIWDESRF